MNRVGCILCSLWYAENGLGRKVLKIETVIEHNY